MKSALIRVPLPAHLALSLTAIALGLALTACSGDSDSDSDASDDSGPGAPLGELATSTAAPAATAVSTATSDPTARPGPRADVIFINGQIITMEADQPSAEALAVLGEDILLVGSNAEVMALAGPGTQTIDLAGRTLMQGFVDAHTHPFGRFESLQQDQQYVLAGGTTTIGDAAVSADKLANVMVALEVTELRVRVSLYLSYNSKCNGLQTEDWILDHPPILDPAEMLRIPGIKIFADPAGPTTSCGWAEMSVLLPPVFAEQRNAELFGQDLFTAAEMAEVITKYQALGYQVAIHTRGDVTTETVLNAIEMALAGEPNSFRHRVEDNDFIRPELLARYGEIGALPVMRGRPFACFLGLTGGNHGFGDETNTWFYPIRSLLEANPGLPIAWHSDVAQAGRRPIRDLFDFVTRKAINGSDGSVCQPPACYAAEAIGVEDALRMMTINGAYALFMEDKVGSLKAGKFADLIVLSQNPLSIDPDAIVDIEVLMTMVGGSVEHCLPGHEDVCAGVTD